MKYELLADDVLLRLLKNNDEQAFEAIFERYWRKIFISAFKKTRSKQVAEDLSQNLFAALWDRRNSSQIEHLHKYLSTGIKNAVINYVNHEFVKQNFTQQPFPESMVKSSADHQVILKDLQNKLNQALSQLSPKTQEIFKLSRFEKYTVKEIAGEFAISEKAVEYHITLCNKQLRIYLKDYLQFTA